MAFVPIDTLIDKEDNFEIVRDQIAAILALEQANQRAKAVTAGKPDPDLWKLRVFTEQSNPLEQWLNVKDDMDVSPIVIVSYDNGTFPGDKGDVVRTQMHSAIYNIDIYGVAVSADNPAGGHKPGDQEATLEAHRALRLVRNILMASNNTYLQLQGTVWKRWPQSINVFKPQFGETPLQHITGARFAFRVDFNEFSPQATPKILELLTTVTRRTEDGQIIIEADFDYTP